MISPRLCLPPSQLPLDRGTPPGLIQRPCPPIVVGPDRILLHGADTVLVDVAGPAGV